MNSVHFLCAMKWVVLMGGLCETAKRMLQSLWYEIGNLLTKKKVCVKSIFYRFFKRECKKIILNLQSIRKK